MLAKKILLRIIYFVMAVQLLAWAIDGLPFTLSLLSIASHAVYLGNMRRFPFVQLTDPLFIASCCTLQPGRAERRLAESQQLTVVLTQAW